MNQVCVQAKVCLSTLRKVRPRKGRRRRDWATDTLTPTVPLFAGGILWHGMKS